MGHGAESESSEWRWVEGTVDEASRHLRLHLGERRSPVALVGPPTGATFVVEFLTDTDDAAAVADALDRLRQELDFYLTEVGGPDPWTYAIHHCGTGANLYSDVHWTYWPEGYSSSAAE